MDEGGRRRWVGGAMEMEEGAQPHSSTMEMPAGGHTDVVENAEAECGQGAQNGSVRVLEAF
jgi:hypothetical protein